MNIHGGINPSREALHYVLTHLHSRTHHFTFHYSSPLTEFRYFLFPSPLFSLLQFPSRFSTIYIYPMFQRKWLPQMCSKKEFISDIISKFPILRFYSYTFVGISIERNRISTDVTVTGVVQFTSLQSANPQNRHGPASLITECTYGSKLSCFSIMILPSLKLS